MQINRDAAIESGASDCMVKSAVPNILLPLLRRWIEARRTDSEEAR
jgi:hypothetical protein